MSEKRRLIFSIVQFLNKELGNEDISDDAKESLEVASQCLQTAYCLGPEDTHLEVSKGLEDIFISTTKNEPVSFSNTSKNLDKRPRIRYVPFYLVLLSSLVFIYVFFVMPFCQNNERCQKFVMLHFHRIF